MERRLSQGIRIGIVGAGLMGQWHAHVARQANANIVAVADIDLERARRLASKYGALAHASADNLMGAADISLLHICAPTNQHLPIAMMALDRNLHLMVEKPLAASALETRTILQKAKDAKALVCPTHQYAFERSVNRIIEQLDRVGEIIAVELKFCSAGAINFGSSAYAQIAADILPHPLSILQRMFPDQHMLENEWRLTSSRCGDWEITTGKDDMRIRINISLLSRPTAASLTVLGTKGSFEADLFHDYVVWSDGRATRRAKILHPFTRSLAHLLSASQNLAFRVVTNEPAYPGLKALTSKFYEACRVGSDAPVSGACILDISEMRDRFLRAAQLDEEILAPYNTTLGASL